MKRIVLSVCAAVAAAVVVQAETYTWVNGAGTWKDGAHWQTPGGSTGTAPSESDEAIIPVPESGAYAVTVDEPFRVGSLVIGGSEAETVGSVTVTISHRQENVVLGNCSVLRGATIDHAKVSDYTYSPAKELYRVVLSVGGDMTVGTGGAVSVSECGYAGNRNSKSAPHAGGLADGESYGSISCPTNYGSTGTDKRSGGAVKIAADGLLTIDGTISANGGNYAATYGTIKASAGGSIWLVCKRLAGSGTLSANGGMCQGSPPSGGRIAVHVKENQDLSGWLPRISALGGDSNTGLGPAGTIYLSTGEQSQRAVSVILSNRNGAARSCSKPAGFTELNERCDALELGTVIVTNYARVKISAGTELLVSGSWLSRGGSLLAGDNASVRFVGSAPATVSCDENAALPSVVCEVPGKEFLFGSGDVFSIMPRRSLVLCGAEGNPIRLDGADGADWKLTLGEGVVQDLSYLSVAHSDASDGIAPTAYWSTGEGNQNWSINGVPADPGAVAWTGAQSSDWCDARNWNPMRVPCEFDDVTIPSAADFQPQLGSSVGGWGRVRSLLVENGAELTLDGANLSVENALTCRGEMACSYRETISVGGNVDFSQGAFSRGESVLLLTGDGSQRVDLGATAFYVVRVAKDTGTVSFADDFTAARLQIESAGALGVRFAVGKTATCDELTVQGSAVSGNDPLLQLVGEGSGAWKLAVRSSANVSGALIVNSDASQGNNIFADMSAKDGGGNTGWHFGSLIQVWTGGVNKDFCTAGNWDPAFVPGPTSRVTIVATDITLASPVTVENLALGDGVATASMTVNAALGIKDSLDVRGNATLTANKPIAVTNLFAVREGATVKHASGSATQANKIDVYAGGAFLLERGGSVTASECGYSRNPNSTNAPHGGTQTDGGSFGSVVEPVDYGKAGTDGSSGGAIKIATAGDLTVNGTITANAHSYAADNGEGTFCKAGAGGSIWLLGANLKGGGSLEARAGDCAHRNGSGGRIAIHLSRAADLSDWHGTVKAYGAKSTKSAAGPAGTVYWQLAGQTPRTATLVVDNGGPENGKSAATGFTELYPATGVAEIGTVIVTNWARVKIPTDAECRVYGDWLGATGNMSESGTLVLSPSAGRAQVSGELDLHGLVCTNGAEEIVFAAGSRATVHDEGTLWMEGTDAKKLVLRSSETGSSWQLLAGLNLTGRMRNLDVSDSDASEGAQIATKRSVGRHARNPNWLFSGGLAVIVK